MKTLIILCLVLAISVQLIFANSATPKKPTVDNYGKQPDKYCFDKCLKYKSVKGQCTDYQWTGAKRVCTQYKTIGKGKCTKYKKESSCVKYKGPNNICVAHGEKQICSKYKSIAVCEKYEDKKVCAHEGSNGYCSAWAYRDVCKEFNQADTYVKCDAYANVPKLDCTSKQRCKHYKVTRNCSKYEKKCKLECDYQVHTPINLKNPTDNTKGVTMYRKVCKEKCNDICVEYNKKLECDSYANVKFCKVKEYKKVCAQPAKKQVDGYVPPDTYAPANDFCKKRERVKYCVKWSAKKNCDNFKTVKCCLKKKTIKYCADYKTVSFCSEQKTLPKRCVKHKHTKKCIEKDEKGQQVCAKYEFQGGVPVCQKYADKTVCVKKQKVCSPYEPEKKENKKPEGKKEKKEKKHKKKSQKKHHKKPKTYKKKN